MKKSTVLISCVMAFLVIISVALFIVEKKTEKLDTYASTVMTYAEFQTTFANTTLVESKPSTTLTSSNSVTTQKAKTRKSNTTLPNTTTRNTTTTATTSGSGQLATTKASRQAVSTTKLKIIPFTLKEKEPNEIEMFNLVNEARESEGLDKLKWDDDLYGVAIIRAKECAELWSHTRPNGESYTSIYYEHHMENKFKDAGENLAKGPTDESDVQALFDALMASPGHKANILNKNYTHCSIAFFYDDNVYVAQSFGAAR